MKTWAARGTDCCTDNYIAGCTNDCNDDKYDVSSDNYANDCNDDEYDISSDNYANDCNDEYVNYANDCNDEYVNYNDDNYRYCFTQMIVAWIIVLFILSTILFATVIGEILAEITTMTVVLNASATTRINDVSITVVIFYDDGIKYDNDYSNINHDKYTSICFINTPVSVSIEYYGTRIDNHLNDVMLYHRKTKIITAISISILVKTINNNGICGIHTAFQDIQHSITVKEKLITLINCKNKL